MTSEPLLCFGLLPLQRLSNRQLQSARHSSRSDIYTYIQLQHAYTLKEMKYTSCTYVYMLYLQMQKGLSSEKRIRLIANQEHHEVGQKTLRTYLPPHPIRCAFANTCVMYERTNVRNPERRHSTIQTSEGF